MDPNDSATDHSALMGLAAPFPVECGGDTRSPINAERADSPPADSARRSNAATPSSVPTPENKGRPTGSWGLADISSIPLPPPSMPVTQIFHACGRDWPVTVRSDAMDNPEEFYACAEFMNPKTIKSVEVKIEVPYFTIRNPLYIGGLQVLSRLCLDPRLGIDEWAEFGRRVGSETIAAIINFALSVSGLSQTTIDAEVESAGEA